MLALLELQREFDAAIRAPYSANDTPWLGKLGLAVYRNNLREGMRKALAADYPVIERLVGADCFRRLAIDYLAAYPSRSGDLGEFGHQFPPFLARAFADTRFAYLADVADLERALLDCAAQADETTATIETLANFDPTRYGELILHTRSTWRLCRSPYPVFSIWRSNRHEVTDESLIDLDAGGERVLLRCDDEGVSVQSVSSGEYEFLQALRDALPLETACMRALAADPAFDAPTLLYHAFEWRLIRRLSLP